jgi:hypothetical protein
MLQKKERMKKKTEMTLIRVIFKWTIKELLETLKFTDIIKKNVKAKTIPSSRNFSVSLNRLTWKRNRTKFKSTIDAAKKERLKKLEMMILLLRKHLWHVWLRPGWTIFWPDAEAKRQSKPALTLTSDLSHFLAHHSLQNLKHTHFSLSHTYMHTHTHLSSMTHSLSCSFSMTYTHTHTHTHTIFFNTHTLSPSFFFLSLTYVLSNSCSFSATHTHSLVLSQ